MIVNNAKDNLPTSGKGKFRKSRSTTPHKADNELVQIFWAAPIEAFFGQETIAPSQIKVLKH